MLPPQIVAYGQQHFPTTADWFIRDAAARHLGRLLSPVASAEKPFDSSPDDGTQAELELLRPLFDELAHRLVLGSGDADMLIIGRWPMMEQATLDVFRRLKHALDTAEGRLETVVARQKPPQTPTSPPDSPVLTKKALRGTPRFGQDDFTIGLIPRATPDLLRPLVKVAEPVVPTAEELGDDVNVQDALRLKPAITKAELAQIGSLLSAVPQPKPKGGISNPILEAASGRKELLALALDPAWAGSGDQSRQEEGLEDIRSPPIFPRRWDSVYYVSRRQAEQQAAPERQILPGSLVTIGKSIIDSRGTAGRSSDDLDSGPAPTEVLNAMQGRFTLPSDVTFSLPSTPSTSSDGGLWSDGGSPSPQPPQSDDFNVILPRRARFAPSQGALAALEPSVLLNSLSESVRPIDMVGGRASEHGPDDIGRELLGVLGSTGTALLEMAKGHVEGPLVKPEDVDFPVPPMPAATDSSLLSTLLPSNLEQLAAGPLARRSKGIGMLSLGLELDWRPFSEMPSQSDMYADLCTTVVDATSTALVADLEGTMRDTGLSSPPDEAGPSMSTLPDADVDFIRTRCELDLRRRGDAVSVDELWPLEAGRQPKRRFLQDLGDGSDDDQTAAHEDLLRIFDDTPSPVLADDLLKEDPTSIASSVDVPYVLADGEVGMDDEELDLDLLEDETPTAPSPEADRFTFVAPTSALAAFIRTRRPGHQLARKSIPPLANVKAVAQGDPLASVDAASSVTVAMPENLPLLHRLGGEEGGLLRDTLHAFIGLSLLNKRKAWRSALNAGIELHHSEAPLLSEPAFGGLDLAFGDVGINLFPLSVLPSIVLVLNGSLSDVRGHLTSVYLLGLIPPERDVWSDATRRSVGVLRRSTSLLAAGPGGTAVRVGWCDEGEVGLAIRRILKQHQPT